MFTDKNHPYNAKSVKTNNHFIDHQERATRELETLYREIDENVKSRAEHNRATPGGKPSKEGIEVLNKLKYHRTMVKGAWQSAESLDGEGWRRERESISETFDEAREVLEQIKNSY
ncbi:MAG: hypothetical protein AAFO94_14135 [Bacteroidota bacterium]